MRALISVSDKRGIVEFSQKLVSLGYEIVSTGGTYKALKESGVSVIAIEDVTGFPEMLDGRVKTLHPKIHAGLLALRENTDHMATCKDHQLELIDLVVVNLYPFQQTIEKEGVTLEEAIENIDIGGPSMLRSAAKNFRSVGVLVNPEKYETVIKELEENQGQLSVSLKEDLACEAFEHTARYDAMIATYLSQNLRKTNGSYPKIVAPKFEKVSDLRYGENPHQTAAFYKIIGEKGLPGVIQHHGKALSYNNIIDTEAAWQIVKSIEQPAAAIIKHTNPCGAAVGASIVEAYRRAHAADPVSAFGSIVGLNKVVDAETAEEIAKTFVEVIIAPGYSDEAIRILTKKPSIRLLSLDQFFDQKDRKQFRFVVGGCLMQTEDNAISKEANLNCVSQKKPSQTEIDDLLFAFNIIRHVKSNAIVIVKDGCAVGVGAGQMSRVEAMEIALKKAQGKTKGAVVASDAFFPFKDSVELGIKAGVSAFIQPGGSKRDDESIACCDESNVAMLFSGVRHFKH